MLLAEGGIKDLFRNNVVAYIPLSKLWLVSGTAFVLMHIL